MKKLGLVMALCLLLPSISHGEIDVVNVSIGDDNSTCDISPSECDYITLSAAETALDKDLTTGGKDSEGYVYIFEVYEMDDYDTGVSFHGWETNEDHYIEVRSVSGERHEGVFDQSVAYAVQGAGVRDIFVFENNFRLYDTQTNNDRDGGGAGVNITMNPLDAGECHYIIKDNVFLLNDATYSTAVQLNTGGNCDSDSTFQMIGNMIINPGSSYSNCANIETDNDVLMEFYNNTCSNAEWELPTFSVTAGQVIAKNNTGRIMWADCADNDSYFDYNLFEGDTSDDDCFGSNGAESTSCTYEDSSNGDFHLSSSDSNCTSAGVDLSAYFTNDIDEDTRSNWSIGADD